MPPLPLLRRGSATRHVCRLRQQMLRLRCAPPSWADASTSAERSEARASWREDRGACRVASPLVMAASNAPRASGLQSEGPACVRCRHYPCFAGVVPHDTPCDSDIARSGFATLRLRGHPRRGARSAKDSVAISCLQRQRPQPRPLKRSAPCTPEGAAAAATAQTQYTSSMHRCVGRTRRLMSSVVHSATGFAAISSAIFVKPLIPWRASIWNTPTCMPARPHM